MNELKNKNNGLFFILYPVYSWDCKIHWLHKCPGYDTKQYDGENLVMLELWGMQSTPSLPLLPGPFWPKIVAPGWNKNKIHTHSKLNYLE